MSNLLRKLTQYQLSLERRGSEESSRFEKDVLATMLYDPTFDKWELDELRDVNITTEKAALNKAFRELGISDSSITEKIETHINTLDTGIKKLLDPKRKELSVMDVFPVSLIRRTRQIIKLARRTEETKQTIFRPTRQYTEILQSFMSEKEFRFSSQGEFQVFNEGEKISIFSLSSGEKQLLILMTETLLQLNEPFIFMADEPELSLHIEWQAEVLSSIRQLNDNAQIIVATHSPEIAGGYNDKIIDMGDIVHG